MAIMSGRGKGRKIRGKAKSRSNRVGFQFPVGRICRGLLTFRKINFMAAVYMAAVIEYLAAKILEMAGNAARDNNKSCIILKVSAARHQPTGHQE